jgi:hypothetical protein
LRLKRNYKYEIIKRKAIKIERLPAPIPEQQRQVKIMPYMKDTRAFWNIRKETYSERKRTCIICGQTAAYTAYFQIEGAKLKEKYCSECVEKWVYLDLGLLQGKGRLQDSYQAHIG